MSQTYFKCFTEPLINFITECQMIQMASVEAVSFTRCVAVAYLDYRMGRNRQCPYCHLSHHDDCRMTQIKKLGLSFEQRHARNLREMAIHTTEGLAASHFEFSCELNSVFRRKGISWPRIVAAFALAGHICRTCQFNGSLNSIF